MSATVDREVEVAGALGLHARPAATLASAAARFDADISVLRGDQEVDAKSMLLILTLDVRQGDRVVLRARGADAEAAVEALAGLLGSP